jgi:hypothetical protein
MLRGLAAVAACFAFLMGLGGCSGSAQYDQPPFKLTPSVQDTTKPAISQSP